MRSKGLLFGLLAFVLVFVIPTQAHAIDFDISEVQIDVELNANGSADVTERFTYEFDDDFNGVTRSLIAKDGTRIENFSAEENGKSLRVETENGLHRIYRSGNDGETVEIELSYKIGNAVEKFEDGAQFYWAFFDESNESDYGEMTITVIPPSPATDTLALGYEEAFGTERITEDGAVIFAMGSVPDGENADVRAIFEPELFPGTVALEGTVRDNLAEDREQLEEEAAIFAQNQQTARNFGIPAIAILGALLLAGIFLAWFRTFRRKRKIKNYAYDFFVPKESMSIPALLHFTNSSFLSPNAISASIMELLRKGHIRQLDEDHFELINRETEHPHEATLIRLLFDNIGNGQEFRLEEVEEFTKNEDNHDTYNNALIEWDKSIGNEVKAKGVYEEHTDLRWMVGAVSVVFIALAIYTGIYELFPWMAASIVLALAAFVFAIGYSPITFEGHSIRHNWRRLKAAMENLPEEQWNQLTWDEKQRAYAYLLGSDPKTAERKAAVFTSAEPVADGSHFMMNPVFMTAIFVSASTTTSASASASGTGMAGTGAGVGGGGGGSGAF